MKQGKIRVPRLSRRGKLARNLCIAVFLALTSWVLAECPAWTEEGALRRLERTLLLEAGAVRCREAGEQGWDAPTVLVVGENYAYTATVYQKDLFWHEANYPSEYATLDGDPVLFRWTEPDNSGSMEQGTWLCPNLPEGAVGAELTISLDYELEDLRDEREHERGSVALSAQGSLEDSGLMRLEITAGSAREAVLIQELFDGSGYEAAEDGTRRRSCTITWADYRLEFFDGSGGSMGTVPVVLPAET